MGKPSSTQAPVASPGGWLWPNLRLLSVFLSLSLLSGCGDCRNWKYLPQTKNEERTIYVVVHGWHTGIVLSREDLGRNFLFLDDYLRPGRYYELGWGEAEFYQAEKVTPGIFLKAVFWSNPSVMHVVSVPTSPEKYFSGSDIVELNVSQLGLERMKDRLYASFMLDAANHAYPLKKGVNDESRFFKAEGKYVITHTCNSWTADLLKQAGVPMGTLPTLRAASLIREARDARKCYLMLQRTGRPFPEHP
jgi:uncharacterized protein (TIGR02117 family)